MPEPVDIVRPRFHYVPKLNKKKSEEAGTNVFDQVPYVEIIIPGDKNTRPTVQVNDSHKQRWPEQWAAFEKLGFVPREGTPLEEWPGCNRAQVEEWKQLGVHTVQELAGMADHLIERLGMGGRQWVKKAQEYLAVAQDKGKVVERVMAQEGELARAQHRIADLEGQLRDLGGELGRAQAQAAAAQRLAVMLADARRQLRMDGAATDPNAIMDEVGASGAPPMVSAGDVLAGVDPKQIVPAGPRGVRKSRVQAAEDEAA